MFSIAPKRCLQPAVDRVRIDGPAPSRGGPHVLRFLLCLLGLAACATASAKDLYTELNRTRAGDGNCSVADGLRPLLPSAGLERVARDLAGGNNLQDALKRAGYRSTRVSTLTISGDGAGEDGIAMLARKQYCPQMTDAGLSEVGIFRDARLVWIVMAAPFAPSVTLSLDAAGKRVLAFINRARAEPRSCGTANFNAARPLRWNRLLAEAARRHAEDMARNNYFDHAGRDGSNPSQRVSQAGYKYRSTGENIAGGQMKPEDAVAGWIKSPTHCANLMNPVFTDMGAAFAVNAKSDMGVYWAQEFGVPL